MFLDNEYVQASGYAARGWSKIVLVENGQRDIQGGLEDLAQAAATVGLTSLLGQLHAALSTVVTPTPAPGPDPLPHVITPLKA